jgi:HEAT repeat protein
LSYFEIERSIVDVLMGATTDSDVRVRVAAATSLGILGSDMAVMGISPLTQDLSVEVRYRAISALGECGNASAAGVLTSLLEDTDPTIRIATLRAIATLGETGISGQIELLLGSESDPDVLAEVHITLERLSQ